MISFSDVLIIGAGHGGAQAAIALRQRDFKGSITILGEEPDYPYERPPPQQGLSLWRKDVRTPAHPTGILLD